MKQKLSFLASFLLFIALVLDIYSLREIRNGALSSDSPIIFQVLLHHGVASLMFGIGFLLLSPESLRSIPWVGRFFVLTVISLLCPVLGGVLLFSSFLIFRYFYASQEAEIKYIGEDEIFAMDEEFDPSHIAASTSIVSVLNQDDEEMRRNAALALRKCEPKFAIPILKRAMQDSDEEVRIYCLNIFNGYSDALEKSIRVLQNRRLRKGSNVEVLQAIADKYSEQVYVGVFEDEQEEIFTLKKAEECLSEALALEADNQDILLRFIKVGVRTGSLEKASECLVKLYEVGFPRELLITWEAELAYLKRDWKETRKVLFSVNEESDVDNSVLELQGFWAKGI